jgi:hypothetical protein
MTKGSEIRRKAGFYGPRVRTKSTTGQAGPREPGPHGLTVGLRARKPLSARQSWLSGLLGKNGPS